MQPTRPKKSGLFLLQIVVPIVLFTVVAAALIGRNADPIQTQGGNVVISEDGDLIIPMEEVSETATFYPVDVDGTALEVLAVKAPDGTIRTAFNTCQVCYDSGRGYYVQQGDYLICQNCGNRFSTSEVEITRGGCNPVPIFSEEKAVNDATITISSEFLTQASFENWKY